MKKKTKQRKVSENELAFYQISVILFGMFILIFISVGFAEMITQVVCGK